MDKFTVLADTREKPEYVWKYNKSKYCAGTEIRKLDHGDYSIVGLEHLLTLERKKSISELAANSVEKRFRPLLENISRYKYKFIICEFPFSHVLTYPASASSWRARRRAQLKPPFLISFINEIRVCYGIDVIFSGSAEAAKTDALSIMKWVWREESC